MIPNEYHWDDVGAPPLETKAGSILEIFKACLITGYGSKPSAGWKLQYDGWIAKGEQRLGFSVGDETEQELIYWLNDTNDNQANLTLWANLNATGDGVENQITTHTQPMRRENNAFKEWHLYATNKFVLFLYQYKNFLTNQGDEGECFLFGAIKDLFGEFLPQIIIQRKYTEGQGIRFYQDCISSGGSFWLPFAPFEYSTYYWGGYQYNSNNDSLEPPAIEYYMPTLCVYQPTDKQPRQLRLYIPSLTITPTRFHPNGDNPEWCKVLEKNGSKILRFCGRNTLIVGFDIGSDWDSPAWLNQIING